MLASHQPLTQVQQLVVTDSHAGQRIDNFLFSLLKGVPKSRLYRILRKGEVRVNKGRIGASYRLCCGDLVRIPPIRVAERKDEDLSKTPSTKLLKLIESSICYEDDHLMVINKPSGLAVHGGSGISLGLIEALRAMRPKAAFLELVHRLDRDTSGCIMVAKRRSMLVHLHNSLSSNQIKKVYFALVKGQWNKKTSVVDVPLLKYTLRSGERMVKVDATGKVAQTGIQILQSYPTATLLQATPITGRTHQIRVHCAHMGHPIIGDLKYGDQESNQEAKHKGLERLFLHAHKLIIKLPYEPYQLIVTSPMPSACEKYLLAI